jgi:hypothetical protein
MYKISGIIRVDSCRLGRNRELEKKRYCLFKLGIAGNRRTICLNALESACFASPIKLVWVGVLLVSVIWLLIVAFVFFAFISDEDWSTLMAKRQQCAIPETVVNGTGADLAARPVNMFAPRAR